MSCGERLLYVLAALAIASGVYTSFRWFCTPCKDVCAGCSKLFTASASVSQPCRRPLRQHGVRETPVVPARLQNETEPSPKAGAPQGLSMSIITLSNGVSIPRLGLGTYLASGSDCKNGVRAALRAGIRHIDTASLYRVGTASAAAPSPHTVMILQLRSAAVCEIAFATYI